MKPEKRPPTSPGEILCREFLYPAYVKKGKTQEMSADEIGISYRTLHSIVIGTGKISAEIAEKLAVWSKTSVEFWTNLQKQHDEYWEDWI